MSFFSKTRGQILFDYIIKYIEISNAQILSSDNFSKKWQKKPIIQLRLQSVEAGEKIIQVPKIQAIDQNPISSADSRKKNRGIFFVFTLLKDHLMGYQMHLISFSGNEKQSRKMAPKVVKFEIFKLS